MDWRRDSLQIMQKLEADFKQTLMGNWAYWIPAQLINFRFVPPAFQVCVQVAVILYGLWEEEIHFLEFPLKVGVCVPPSIPRLIDIHISIP